MSLAVRAGRGLLVVPAGGHHWHLPLAAADIARAQAVMDVVDSRMGKPGAVPTLSPALGLVLAFIMVSLGLSVGQYALAFTAALALVQPAAPLISAAGPAAITAAGLIWRDLAFASSHDLLPWLPFPLLVLGRALPGVAL